MECSHNLYFEADGITVTPWLWKLSLVPRPHPAHMRRKGLPWNHINNRVGSGHKLVTPVLAWAGWGLRTRLVKAGEKFLLRVNTFFSHSHYPWVSNNAWCASMKYEFLVNSDCHAMWFTPSLHLIYEPMCVVTQGAWRDLFFHVYTGTYQSHGVLLASTYQRSGMKMVCLLLCEKNSW